MELVYPDGGGPRGPQSGATQGQRTAWADDASDPDHFRPPSPSSRAARIGRYSDDLRRTLRRRNPWPEPARQWAPIAREGYPLVARLARGLCRLLSS
jgi:hypothetical protein